MLVSQTNIKMSRIILSSLESGVSKLKPTSHQLYICNTSQKSPCIQCVRSYRPRKPFWLPMGKTKMFKIPKKPQIPEEEEVEILRLYNVYKTNMKSLR